MTDAPDLFRAALDARDREIERLRAVLADARARVAELERARGPVLGEGDILLLPSAAWGGFVRKEAARAIDAMNPREHAPRHVARVLDRVRTYRTKAGVGNPSTIETDVEALRAALWREIERLWSEVPVLGGATPAADNGGGAA